MGGTGVTAKLSRALRVTLREECSRHEECVLVELESHSSHANTFQRQSEFPYGVYAESIFCLMPGGDFPTRKAFMDAVLSGCIPVTFNVFSGISQMPFHWGNAENAKSIVVNIPREQMIKHPSIEFQKLIDLSVNKSFVIPRRRKIAQIGHRLQYMLPGGFNSENRLTAGNSASQVVDAVDVSLRSMFFRQSGR